MNEERGIVAVAMSGGVDSSTAACLLAEQGYRVIGITLKLFCYSSRTGPERSCCNLQAIADARSVCDRIGAPHYVLGAETQFRKEVIDRFVDTYLEGRTPNPCADCNTYIKFHFLLEKARKLGADHLATGHYVRLVNADAAGRDTVAEPRLARGRDPEKDQSYFLWGIPRRALPFLLFPLGEYRKSEVRELAHRFGLAVAEKVESQEICFVESGSIEEYIRSHQQERGETDHPGLKPGEVVDTRGRKLGEHRGAAFYTIGQRKGLGVSLGKPAYVTSVDTAAGRIVLGEGEDLLSSKLEASPVNFLTDPPAAPFRAEVQIRYRSRPVAATVIPDGPNGVKVKMDLPQRSVAPGQSVVFYDGGVVIGGGIIRSAG